INNNFCNVANTTRHYFSFIKYKHYIIIYDAYIYYYNINNNKWYNPHIGLYSFSTGKFTNICIDNNKCIHILIDNLHFIFGIDLIIPEEKQYDTFTIKNPYIILLGITKYDN